MNDASNSNRHDANTPDDISAGLEAEIERGLTEESSAAGKKSSASDERKLDAVCDAVIAETPHQLVSHGANENSAPLASLLHTIHAVAHATEKPDARLQDEKLLQEIEQVAEACVTEYSLKDIAQSCGELNPPEPKILEKVQSVAPQDDTAAPQKAPDRRRRRRALISAPVRVRGVHITHEGPDEISTTLDVSRFGILFATSHSDYSRGMDVMVTFPYSPSKNAVQAEQAGRVVRVHEDSDGRRRVAIALGIGVGEDLVDSCGRKLENAKINLASVSSPDTKTPMVLAVDSDSVLRDSMKTYLQNEGYEVIAVSSNAEAREVLDMFTPALVIAEVEGEGLPGFDVCAHVKSSSRLRNIPVVLITRSAYPSDYSNAHSIGAVVCMAKPFKQERLGHVVRLLAPLPVHLQPKFIPRPGDASRRPGCDANGNGRKKLNGNGNGNGNGNNNGNGRRFRFPSFR